MTPVRTVSMCLILSLALVLLTSLMVMAQTESDVLLPSLSDGVPSASSRPSRLSAQAPAADRLGGEASSNAVYYVKHDAVGANDGTSWTDAYTDLQDALAVAVDGDEIWVARGVYVPGKNIHRTFSLTQGVAIYGGFAGEPGSEGDSSVRDYETYVSVLSGDVDRDDETDANGVVTSTGHVRSDNSIHVITSVDASPATRLDGLTITAAAGNQYHLGIGMTNTNGSPTLANLSFVGNYVNALYNEQGSPALSNVTFIHNFTHAFVNIRGDPVLNHVSFVENSYSAMENREGNPLLTDVTFLRNRGGVGAGLLNIDGSPTLVNVTFSENLYWSATC